MKGATFGLDNSNASGTNMDALIASKKETLIYAREEGGILWTVSTLHRELSSLNRELNILRTSLPYAGIHQDLGYRHFSL